MSNVKLIAVTTPTTPEYGETVAEFIAYVARVSNPGNQWNHATARKLLNFLEREKHWSPFEMANLVLEIRTSRAIGRQIMRHSPRLQEFSQRYSDEIRFLPPVEARLQDEKNRQNSLPVDDAALAMWWNDAQKEVIELVSKRFREARRKGIAKECARAILPEGLTESVLYLNGNVRDWMHYCAARTNADTQKEHREIAEQVYDILMREME